MISTVAYIRVSSKAQTFDTQRDAIERAAVARGDVIAEWYAEKKSAKTIQREELHRLRDDARAGAFRKVYVFRIDRLTRSGIRDTFELIEELRAHGVEIVTVADGFDLSGPAAEVVLAVMAWASKMEWIARNERIAAARERLEDEGRAWGRPRRMTAEQIAKARVMAAQGRSQRSIAMALKIAKSTIARALGNGRIDPR